MRALLLLVLFASAGAQEWFDRGVKLHEAGEYGSAIEAFTKSRQAGYANPGAVNLRIARSQVKAAQNDAALATLKLMTDGGFARVESLLAEMDLVPLRSDPRWNEIVETARANQRPCASRAESRQFDYWLGEWDVEVQGRRSARSSIQLILGDCTVYENFWTIDGTYSGKSFSVWDAGQKRWEQRYVDSTGASRDWFGTLQNDRMVFYLRPDANGVNFVQRMTYTKEGPDRVRQTIEVSADGEKSWSTAFDGLYIRRK